MNKNLRLIDKTARLERVWVANGDPRMPLTCKWVEQTAGKAQENGRDSQKRSSAAKAHADLVGLLCWLTPVTLTGFRVPAACPAVQAAEGTVCVKEIERHRRCA